MEIPQNWTFKSEEVANNFERHVREQLPWYEMATGAVAHIARHYLPHGGRAYDIGASTGNMGRVLAQAIEDRAVNWTAIEQSKEMATLYRGPGHLEVCDALGYDFKRFDVAILFLSLMFFPVSARGSFLKKLYSLCNIGGAIIILDKIPIAQDYPAVIMNRLALAGKMATGVQPEEIIKKELSLGGIQRHIHKSILPKTCVEFFRFGDFAGVLCERPER